MRRPISMKTETQWRALFSMQRQNGSISSEAESSRCIENKARHWVSVFADWPTECFYPKKKTSKVEAYEVYGLTNICHLCGLVFDSFWQTGHVYSAGQAHSIRHYSLEAPSDTWMSVLFFWRCPLASSSSRSFGHASLDDCKAWMSDNGLTLLLLSLLLHERRTHMMHVQSLSEPAFAVAILSQGKRAAVPARTRAIPRAWNGNEPALAPEAFKAGLFGEGTEQAAATYPP